MFRVSPHIISDLDIDDIQNKLYSFTIEATTLFNIVIKNYRRGDNFFEAFNIFENYINTWNENMDYRRSIMTISTNYRYNPQHNDHVKVNIEINGIFHECMVLHYAMKDYKYDDIRLCILRIRNILGKIRLFLDRYH
jgi:hypothetical protein